jgi:hypothetical protein
MYMVCVLDISMLSLSALTWLIRYIIYWNLELLNNVIINKTKIPLTQTLLTFANFGCHFYTFDLLDPKD